MIKAREINKFYGSGESRFQVLKNISLMIEDGDFVVILGASGSGKSTLLNVLSGLERAESGQIFYDDTEITGLTDKELTAFRRKKIGFIFQQYYLLQNMNVGKNVKMGADLAVNSDYKAILKEVGLENKLYKFPANCRVGNSSVYRLPEHLPKDRRFYFWTNLRVPWMKIPAGRFCSISVNCRRNTDSRLSW